ncbi:MAG: SO_0444 family Cu/Zn efflux transporter [Fibrobacterota bacterium]
MVELLIDIRNTFNEMAPYLLFGLAVGGLLHLFFKKEFIQRHLGSNNIVATIKAALFGVPLPLCSCSVVPTAISLKKKNASQGSIVSFLISTPQTGVDSIMATYGLMGPFMAVIRPVAAMISGITGGLIAGHVPVKSNPSARTPMDCAESSPQEEQSGLFSKIRNALNYAFVDLLDGISLNILVGIIISGLITFFVPDDFFGRHIGNQWVEMLIMLVGGIPLYVCSTGSIPIALSLMLKGISPGAAFVFLVAGPATNAATITVLLSHLGRKVTAVYIGTIVFFSFLFGWIINLFRAEQIVPLDKLEQHIHGSEFTLLSIQGLLSLVFLILMLASLWRLYLRGTFLKLRNTLQSTGAKGQEETIGVSGMTCGKCAARVETAALSTKGITAAKVDLDSARLIVQGDFNRKELQRRIKEAGYSPDE